MTLVVSVVLGVLAAATVLLARSHEVDRRPLSGLQFIPYLGAPAGDFRDGVSERHVAYGWSGSIDCEGRAEERREPEGFDNNHPDQTD